MTKKMLVSLSTTTIILVGIGIYAVSTRPPKDTHQEIPIESSNFQVKIPATGSVQPENKISINSPIAGRIDRILIEEGQKVRRGQIIAWMSSTDRAALMDTARSQGGESLKEWEDVYRPTPIVSSANGEIIARSIVVGQTVSQQTLLFELSDRLVVMADLDETDVGKIHVGQEAQVKVDSFPDIEVQTKVVRIAKQSVIKNNINTYEVLLSSERLPSKFRSGMTANIQFIYQDKPKALVVPTWVADGRENFTSELLLKVSETQSEMRKIVFGFSNGEKIEVLSGAQPGDVFLLKSHSVLNEAVSAPFGVMGGGKRR